MKGIRQFIGFMLLCGAFLCGTTLFVVPAFSQSNTTGEIAGVISDPSGAVVANAKVTAKNDATGAGQTVVTNGSGIFHLSFLPPGNYTITVSATGFQTAPHKLQVGIGQASTANIQMELTSSSTIMEVTTQALQIENADLTTRFDAQQVSSIPNPGNDLTVIAQTAPGATMNTGGGFGNFSVYGLPATSNLFTVDGQNNNDPFLNLNNSGATNLTLGQNDVQEATVVTNGYSGQYGQLAGAQINYVTRSGSNDWHGNARWQWNGRSLNANDYFNNLSGTPRPFDNANQWAGSFGGPIQRDKTFFFFNYEGLRVVLPTSNLTLIPSPQFQQATLANVAGNPAAEAFYQNIFNLYSHANGAANAVPVTGGGCNLTPNQLALVAGQQCANQFTSTAGNFTHEYIMNLRIDHNFSDNDRIFGRVATDQGVQATFTDPISPLFNITSNQPQYSGQLGWTHILNSNMVNEFKASGLWYTALFNNANRAASLAAFPTTLAFGDGSFTALGGINNIFPQGRNVTQYQFVDDFSLSKGRHTFKLGVNYHRNDVTDFDYGSGTSGLAVANNMSSFFNGGPAPANDPGLLPGSGDSLQQNFPTRLSQPIALYDIGFYGTDEWRVTNRLKLTLGLRLDHNSNPVCQTNCFARLNEPFTTLTAQNPNAANIPYNQVIQSGLHQAYPGTDIVVWQPRLGFTWSPFSGDKTVISGGIGIFTDSFPNIIVDNLSENAPFFSSFTPVNAPIAPAQNGSLFNLASASNAAFTQGFAQGLTFGQIQAANSSFVAPGLTSSNTRVRQPRYQEWNLRVQHNLGWNTVASLNYSGNHGIFEAVPNASVNAFGFGSLPATAPDAAFGKVTQVESGAVSNYNGVTATLQHNFNHGFATQINYTWSHALDEISNGGFLNFTGGTDPSTIQPTNPFNLRANYGNADYDIRHVVNLSYVWADSLRHLFHWGPNQVFGGWDFAGAFYLHSGLPFTATDGTLTNALAGNNYFGSVFANVVGSTKNANCGTAATTGGAVAGTPCLNVNGFTPAGNLATGFGKQERNQFRGPGYVDNDFNVMKNFKLPGLERGNLGVGFQFFNLFNHPNFDLPVNNIASAKFGLIEKAVSQPTTILGSGLGGDASPRLIQFKAEFKF